MTMENQDARIAAAYGGAARFSSWEYPRFDERGMTRWGWMAQHPEHLELGHGCDIGAFTYINAKHGVVIGEGAQIGSHCSIYSVSTIDERQGRVTIDVGASVGAHSVIMPGVHIGRGAIVGACSFVNRDIPAHSLAFGTPARVVGHRNDAGWARMMERADWNDAIEREKANT